MNAWPAQITPHFTVPSTTQNRNAVLVDRAAAGARVRVEELGDVAEAADELVGDAEPPRLHAQPAEILDRIAEVRELPVEHGADALGRRR